MKFLKVTISDPQQNHKYRVKYFLGDEKEKADEYIREFNHNAFEASGSEWKSRAEVVLYEIDDALVELIVDWHERKKITL